MNAQLEVPSILTPKLALRPLQASDAETLHRIYQADGVLRYFPNPTPPPLEKIQRFLANQQTHWEQYGYGNWGIIPKGASEIVGWAGLQFLPELNETEVGFLLDRPYWGKGFATEAALASLHFGFECLGLAQVIALVYADNLASRRVLEKCGLTYMEKILIWKAELLRYKKDNPALYLENRAHAVDEQVENLANEKTE